MRMANHERPRNHCRQLHAGSSPCRPASGKSSLPCRHRRNHHLRPPRFRPEAPLQNHCCAACRHPSPSRKRLPHPLSRPTLILTQKTTALPIPDILPAMNARTGRAALGFAKADISVGRCLRFQTTEMFAAEYCARPQSTNARTQRHVLIYQLAVQAAGGREAFPAVHTVFLACPFKTECAGSWQDNLRHSRQHASIFRSNARALDESGYAPLCKSGHLRWAMLTLPNS